MRQQTASPIHGMRTLVYAASVGRIATVRHVIGSFFTVLPARHYRLNYVFRIDSLFCFNHLTLLITSIEIFLVFEYPSKDHGIILPANNHILSLFTHLA